MGLLELRGLLEVWLCWEGRESRVSSERRIGLPRSPRVSCGSVDWREERGLWNETDFAGMLLRPLVQALPRLRAGLEGGNRPVSVPLVRSLGRGVGAGSRGRRQARAGQLPGVGRSEVVHVRGCLGHRGGCWTSRARR